ncbi:MAG: prepilin-type N-terminal cleavage/methylation domain-containing protein, partial [Gammaproteobacteria bacterium]|nr:prepilin-type N-terminal cleavage/methylation domain-containing protein [Gammaproteobacteria bacterium]
MKRAGRSGLARVYGFSLLEVLLSLALASVILLAASQLLQSLIQRANWWQLLSNMVVTRESVVKSFAILAEQVCQPGFIIGEAGHWRWHWRQSGGACQIYDVRFQADKQQLQKRRLGGRYSGFIDSISALTVSYGVSGQGDCVVRQWLPEVNDQLARQTLLLRLQFAVGVLGQPP